MRPTMRDRIGATVAVVLMLSLTSCASSTSPSDSEWLEEASNESEPEKAAIALPPEISQALIPRINLGREVVSDRPEPRFDITVDRAPARQFFMTLVEDTSYSLALAPEINGEISLALKDVTVEEVLDTVQQAYGFGFERTRTGFLVLPSGLRTQVFKLDYLNLTRAGSSETRVSSGQITDGDSGGGTITDIGDSSSSNSSNANPGNNTGSFIQTVNETNLWDEILYSVESIVGAGEGRSVVVSPNAGLLVVRAPPAELAKVARYLRSAEDSLNRVVILEAKILEVSLSDGFQAGINWALLTTDDNDALFVGQTGGGSVDETGFSETRGQAQNLGGDISDLVLGGMGSAFGGVFSVALKIDQFAAFIEALERQGDVRTLSNPRISTINNQKAVIKVGNDEFFVTDVSSTTVTGVTTTSNPNVTLTPFFSGIALDVTPQISEDNDVILHVHPSVTEVVDQTKSFTISDELVELPLAFSSTRESDSIVRAKSGEVIVIGGLIQNSERDSTHGIPFLSRIPWLGRLFSHSTVGNRRTELVILLRPIVVEEDTWDDDLRRTAGRIEAQFENQRSYPDDHFGINGWLPPTPPVSQ